VFPFHLSHLSTHVPAPSGSGSSESASGMHLLVLGKQLRPMAVCERCERVHFARIRAHLGLESNASWWRSSQRRS
jgi:hypothetical protein